MIGLAAANAVIQFGVIVVALRMVADQQKRSVIVTIAGTAQALTAFWFGTRHGSGRRADGCRRVGFCMPPSASAWLSPW